MNNLIVKLKPYTPLVLRLSLGFVFFWSGFSKIADFGNAIGVCTSRAEAIDFVSLYTWLPFDPEVFVWIQSILELVLGSALMVGLLVPLAATVSVVILALFFALIDFSLVWKNAGLFGAALALLGSETDKWSLDSYFKRRRERVGKLQV